MWLSIRLITPLQTRPCQAAEERSQASASPHSSLEVPKYERCLAATRPRVFCQFFLMLESRLVQSQNNEQESLLGSNIDRTLDRQHSPIMKDLTCQNASQSHMWDLHTQYSTLIPSTHCLNLTQTNENLNGEIVTREAEQHHRANPCDNIFRQMHIKCRRGDEKHGSKRTNETL